MDPNIPQPGQQAMQSARPEIQTSQPGVQPTYQEQDESKDENEVSIKKIIFYIFAIIVSTLFALASGFWIVLILILPLYFLHKLFSNISKKANLNERRLDLLFLLAIIAIFTYGILLSARYAYTLSCPSYDCMSLAVTAPIFIGGVAIVAGSILVTIELLIERLKVNLSPNIFITVFKSPRYIAYIILLILLISLYKFVLFNR